MNTYLWIHRAKGPAMLVIFGITALLNEWDLISFGHSWPLYLIALGLFQLAERAAWSQAQAQGAGVYPDPATYGAPYAGAPGYPPYTPYAGAPYPGAPYPGTQAQQPPSAPASSSASPSGSLSISPYDKQDRS